MAPLHEECYSIGNKLQVLSLLNPDIKVKGQSFFFLLTLDRHLQNQGGLWLSIWGHHGCFHVWACSRNKKPLKRVHFICALFSLHLLKIKAVAPNDLGHDLFLWMAVNQEILHTWCNMHWLTCIYDWCIGLTQRKRYQPIYFKQYSFISTKLHMGNARNQILRDDFKLAICYL